MPSATDGYYESMEWQLLFNRPGPSGTNSVNETSPGPSVVPSEEPAPDYPPYKPVYRPPLSIVLLGIAVWGIIIGIGYGIARTKGGW